MAASPPAKALQKFDDFVLQYESSHYDAVPKFVKRRVDALKKLQLEHIKLHHQYNLRLQELELEFEKLHQPLYEKRTKIINGEYEPTDEECKLPEIITENEFNGDQENEDGSKDPLEQFSKSEEQALQSQVKGIPGFWLGCLSSTYNFNESIEDYDRVVLKYLNDIKLFYDNKDDLLIYKLEFHFDENPHFTNRVLTKTYYLKSSPDEKDPFSYEGFEVFKSEGCEINWNPGKDVTVEPRKVTQKNKENGKTRQKERMMERDSFFLFFKPPQVPEDPANMDEELGAVVAVDFELGELIRQSLIPKASLYYTGYMMDDEDDDDDDDDDLDSDEGSDFDESSADNSTDDDSLAKRK